jgi:hypothetical protein
VCTAVTGKLDRTVLSVRSSKLPLAISACAFTFFTTPSLISFVLCVFVFIAVGNLYIMKDSDDDDDDNNNNNNILANNRMFSTLFSYYRPL